MDPAFKNGTNTDPGLPRVSAAGRQGEIADGSDTSDHRAPETRYPI
jgi:hypothetical protein